MDTTKDRATHSGAQRNCLRNWSAFAALIALAGCASPMPPTDTPTVDATDVLVMSDTTPDTTPPRDATDAMPPADGGTCIDVSGGWEWTGSCSIPEATVDALSCISQTGCSFTELGSSASNSGTVSGNVARYDVAIPNGLRGTCTITVNGEMATLRCDVMNPSFTCDATGRRTTFAGATNYCCDVSNSTCGTGQRCQVFQSTNSTERFTACIPAGTIAEGSMCTRAMMGRVGADQCAAGLFCSTLGQPSLTQFACQRLCTNGSNCRAGEVCFGLGNVPHSGLCRPTCTILGSDCPSGLSCRDETAWGGEAPVQDVLVRAPSCIINGTTAEGGACVIHQECVANHNCAIDTRTTGGARSCRRACDLTHACPMGQTCVEFTSGDINPLGLGSCYPN